MKIAVFFHCTFYIEDRLQPAAASIVQGQMRAMCESGLTEAASEIHVGVNGGVESDEMARSLLPSKANLVFHGTTCRNECRTLLLLEAFAKEHASEEWAVCYHHAKGTTHPLDLIGNAHSTSWRQCMERHTIKNWQLCVKALEEGYDAAGAHYMTPPATPAGQHIFAGNFFWTTASFLRTLPSLYERERIKMSGIDASESRYEAEVYLGNGPRPMKVKDFHENWNPSKIATCSP